MKVGVEPNLRSILCLSLGVCNITPVHIVTYNLSDGERIKNELAKIQIPRYNSGLKIDLSFLSKPASSLGPFLELSRYNSWELFTFQRI